MDAKVLSRAIVIATEEGGKALLCEIEIECPDCGDYVVMFMGHHLKAIRDSLTEIIEHYPDLVEGGEIKHMGVTQWSGRPPRNPADN